MIGAPSSPSTDTKDGPVRRRIYKGTGDAEVVYITIDGMGHHWSGHPEHLPERIVGKSIDPIDTTEEMWTFFAKHTLP